MDHRTINSIIIAGAIFLVGLVLLAVFYGPGVTSDASDDEATPVEASDNPRSESDDTANEITPNVTPDQAQEPSSTPTDVPVQAVSGLVTDAESEEPLAGVTVSIVQGGIARATTTSNATGEFRFPEVPAGSQLVFSMDGYLTTDESLPQGGELQIAMRASVLAGQILDSNGEPIFDATVASGEALTWTDENGQFRLDKDEPGSELIAKAPGYFARSIPVSELTEEIVLEDKEIKGIYTTAGSVADTERFHELLDMVERTELNAVVVDIKDSAGYVFHNTDVEMAHEIDGVLPAYNAESVIEEIQSRGIYAIARIVIFEDPILAQARPELAIQDSREGGIWHTFTGLPWANPYREEVWDYNIELMQEAVELGFDEVQLDYMRFPTDGPLNRADYGQESNAETRDRAIATFLERSYEALAPTPAYLTGDIFGMTLWDPTEGEIGQKLVTVAERLDYVHPMIYPSHFYEGAMGFEVPNDHPYEVIYQSLEHGMRFLEDHQIRKMRPWLQDFSYGVGIEYGPTEVREQIRASEDFGANGWMLWNAAASYHEEALEPAE